MFKRGKTSITRTRASVSLESLTEPRVKNPTGAQRVNGSIPVGFRFFCQILVTFEFYMAKLAYFPHFTLIGCFSLTPDWYSLSVRVSVGSTALSPGLYALSSDSRRLGTQRDRRVPINSTGDVSLYYPPRT